MPRLVPREHGSVRGYHQHRAAKEVPCRGCCAAWAAECQRRYRVGRCAKGLGWPLEAPQIGTF